MINNLAKESADWGNFMDDMSLLKKSRRSIMSSAMGILEDVASETAQSKNEREFP